MSNALERVITEQQAQIDLLKKQLESSEKTVRTMFSKHEKLFDVVGRLIDTNAPREWTAPGYTGYQTLRRDSRLAMLDAGWCFGCYSFCCECEPD